MPGATPKTAAGVTGVLGMIGLMQSMAAGAMEVVFAPLDQVEQTIAPLAPRVSIAAINGPACIVISGSPTDVAAASQRFAADGISTQRLASWDCSRLCWRCIMVVFLRRSISRHPIHLSILARQVSCPMIPR